MRTIYKYALAFGNTIQVPAGEIVHVGHDPSGVECVWVDHDTTTQKMLDVCVVGTGHTVPEDYTHAGSYLSGRFVWHVYFKEVV